MANLQSLQKFEETLEKFAEKLILKTILCNLSNSDVRLFIDLLLGNKFEEAEKLVQEKIPNLKEKIEEEEKKRFKNIFQRVKGQNV